MKKIFKNIILLSVLFVGILPIVNFVNWWYVKLFLPDATWQDDINIENTQVQDNETTILAYIKIINKYLWFAIGWVAMAVLVYAWIKLITAWWKDTKKARDLALSCIISILVAMLSYNLVNLIVKLF